MANPPKNSSRRSRGARHPNPLFVWTDGRQVGQWTVREGEHRFQYADDFAASPERRALSISLPMAADNAVLRGPVVENWFDNLLPTGIERRHRLQRRFGTASTDAFDLLTKIGRDCAGAVQVLPPGVAPEGFDRAEGEPMNDDDIVAAINAALSTSRASGQGEAVLRSALSGTQEKIALMRHGDRWMRPVGAMPTTHILKLASPSVAVENEWLCSRVMAAFGFRTAACAIETFGPHAVLAIERHDRAMSAATTGARIDRLPREDLCQALGVPAARRYEADGGPGMKEVLRLLESNGDDPADRTTFVRSQMVCWLLAATDVHAKSLSVQLAPGGRLRLAPFHGVSSAWPSIAASASTPAPTATKPKLAMALRSKSAHWGLSDLRAQHWDGVARLAGLADARTLCAELAEQVPGVIARVEAELPGGFPDGIARPILDGLRATAARLGDTGNAGAP